MIKEWSQSTPQYRFQILTIEPYDENLKLMMFITL